MFNWLKKKQPDPVFITAHLNCRLTPFDREHYFGDPLDEVLKAASLGEVSGGGTMMGADKTIQFIDLEICLEDVSDATLDLIAATLDTNNAPKGSYIHDDDNNRLREFGSNEILSVTLDGVSLPPEAYEVDSDQILDAFLAALGDAGRFQGSIAGPTHTEFLFSGSDFSAMLTRVQPLLDTAIWAKGALIEQVA